MTDHFEGYEETKAMAEKLAALDLPSPDREEALELSGAFFEKKLISVFQEVDGARDAILKNANVRLTLISLLSKL